MTFKLAAFSANTYVFLIPNAMSVSCRSYEKRQGSWLVLNKRQPRSLFLKLSAYTPLNGFTFYHHSPYLRGL